MANARDRKTFESKLFRYPGPGGWTFAPVPDAHAPPVTHGWGRTPVVASVDGHTWKTSVWRDKKYGTLLAVPKKVRGAKGDGDVVRVSLSFDGAMDELDGPPKKVGEAVQSGPARASRGGQGGRSPSSNRRRHA
jgi:hypothetical protein